MKHKQGRDKEEKDKDFVHQEFIDGKMLRIAKLIALLASESIIV